jgi:hypothetical protein
VEPRRYRQIFLSPEELDYGLTIRHDRPRPPDHWEAVPWFPVAVLAEDPDALETRLGVTFQDTLDQLDYLRLVLLELPSGLRAALLRHRGAHGSGTDLYILPQQRVSVAALRRHMDAAIDSIQDAVLTEIVEALGLDREEVDWVRPHLTDASSDRDVTKRDGASADRCSGEAP